MVIHMINISLQKYLSISIVSQSERIKSNPQNMYVGVDTAGWLCVRASGQKALVSTVGSLPLLRVSLLLYFNELTAPQHFKNSNRRSLEAEKESAVCDKHIFVIVSVCDLACDYRVCISVCSHVFTVCVHVLKSRQVNCG